MTATVSLGLRRATGRNVTHPPKHQGVCWGELEAATLSCALRAAHRARRVRAAGARLRVADVLEQRRVPGSRALRGGERRAGARRRALGVEGDAARRVPALPRGGPPGA